MTRKMNVAITGINVAVLMGLFLFLGKAWAAEPKPVTHPVVGNAEKQPSRDLYDKHLDQGMARVPAKLAEPGVVVAKMNQRANQILFRDTLQRIAEPNAFKSGAPVAKVPNPHQREMR